MPRHRDDAEDQRGERQKPQPPAIKARLQMLEPAREEILKRAEFAGQRPHDVHPEQRTEDAVGPLQQGPGQQGATLIGDPGG